MKIRIVVFICIALAVGGCSSRSTEVSGPISRIQKNWTFLEPTQSKQEWSDIYNKQRSLVIREVRGVGLGEFMRDFKRSHQESEADARFFQEISPHLLGEAVWAQDWTVVRDLFAQVDVLTLSPFLKPEKVVCAESNGTELAQRASVFIEAYQIAQLESIRAGLSDRIHEIFGDVAIGSDGLVDCSKAIQWLSDRPELLRIRAEYPSDWESRSKQGMLFKVAE